MIILTTPNIKKFNPIRQSSTENWASEDYCLAEVDDSFCPDDTEMKKEQLDFWWVLQDGHFDVEKFDNNEHSLVNNVHGLVEAIYHAYDVSNPWNLAMAIHVVSKNIGGCPFEFWEKYNQSN